MHRWHQPFLGVRDIPAWLPQFEVEAFFTFDAIELAAIRLRRTTDHAFGLALQIGFLRMSGRCLNGVRMLPRAVLMHIGLQIGAAPAQLASLRALYSRTMTLHEHQSVAMQLLGFQALGERAERMLVAHLRRACPASIRADEMLLEARKWIYEHRYLIPNERRVLDVARRVVMTSEAALVRTFERAIPLAVRRAWFAQLQERVPHAAHLTRLQWLQASPRARRGRSLDEAFMRVHYLYELGVHRCLQPEIAHEKLRGYAQRLTRTRQSRFNQLGTATRTVALVAFLRLALFQSTDIAVELWLMRVTDLKRQAYGRAIERHAKAATRRFQDLVQGINALDGACRSDKRWRAAARDLVERARRDAPLTKAAHMREAMLNAGATVRGLLRLLLAFPVSCVAEQPHLQHAIDLIRTLHAEHRWSLPETVTTCPFAPLWRVLVADSNRRLAFAAFEAATLLTVARGLRNGMVAVGHSLMHQRRESLFIPQALWQQDERFFLRQLDCSSAFSFWRGRKLDLHNEAFLELAKAVRRGDLVIDAKGVRIAALRAEPEAESTERLRQEIFDGIGCVEFAEVIMQTDSECRFSWQLLKRAPHSEAELLALYAAILAHGTGLDAAEVIKMMPGVKGAALANSMRLLEDETRLQAANHAAVQFMRRHAITGAWGETGLASSDMMTLEATHRLWNARIDPRHRMYAIGTYTHVLDRWGIVYDQPIVLNRRQAGAAIEGVLRQRSASIDRLAVDTHGYTDVAMGLAKLLGFDLCPRLASLRERRLYVGPRTYIPKALELITDRISTAGLERHWDELLRIAASVKDGWCSAVLALDRLGADARGDPVYQAAVTLGRLVRTRFLCDYLTRPSFRRALHRCLDHGESVHQLQRTIMMRPITAKRGRSHGEQAAISGSLALLTNIVMTWNTHAMQRRIDGWKASPGRRVDKEDLAHIAPVATGHINFRGRWIFPMQTHAERILLRPTGTSHAA